MSKFSFKKDVNNDNIEIAESDLTFSDFLIDSKDLLERYDKEEWKEACDKIGNFQLPEFEDIQKILRKYSKITLHKSIQDLTVESIIQKRNEVRNAINTVIEIKYRFLERRKLWKDISSILGKMYERTKDSLIVTDEIKELKNDNLRQSEVNVQLKDLVKTLDKLELVMMRFKQIEDEIRETLLYLQDVKDEISRNQSAVQLALDTGEIDKVYWNKPKDN
jgi:hypothetical protein